MEIAIEEFLSIFIEYNHFSLNAGNKLSCKTPLQNVICHATAFCYSLVKAFLNYNKLILLAFCALDI